MMKKKPEFIFESSWEVCNKVGGIHTVITSKLPEMHKIFGDNIIFIGPDILRNEKEHPEFIEDKNLFNDWRTNTKCGGLRVRIGRWKTVHEPIAFLVDFSSFIPKKDTIFTHLWETYQLDSLSGQWDYTESALFGYAVGQIIESFSDFYLENKAVVAHLHEWMTGAAVLYLNEYAPEIATIFTTHATVLGRSIAGNNQPLYSMLDVYSPDSKAAELGVTAKHSLEKNAATYADSFTTVSQVTAKECKYLLQTTPDFVTPNGFSLDHLEPITKDKVKDSRVILSKVTEALTGTECDENTTFLITSGRYEYKNKGIDVYLDALGNLNKNENLKHPVIGFITIPADQYGARADLLKKLNEGNNDVIEDNLTTHSLNPLSKDPIIQKCNELQLLNFPGQQVRVIFVPVYLNGKDEIFNKNYYDLLCGFDISAFPSYYEPWGYTPQESIAVGVPTITTSLAGYGQWMKSYANNILEGLKVVDRNEENYSQVVESIEQCILNISNASTKEKELSKAKASKLSAHTKWDQLFEIYIKAYTKAVLLTNQRELKQTKKKITEGIMEKPAISFEPNWKKMIIHSNLPDSLKALEKLSMNLWWCWNYEAVELFQTISPNLWEKCDKNPIALLKKVSSDRFQELETDKSFITKLNKVNAEFIAYMNADKKENFPKIAYFSMEYGLTDNLKIFSGGLGILAGDYLKEASDSNVPMVAVGFLYKFGYFTQHLSVSGEQQASLVAQKFANLPITPLYDEDRQLKTISVSLPGRDVKARIWQVNVGRVPLYLLDTDYRENSPEDKAITHQLYGGDWENRLKQEIILGLGGIRTIKELGLEPEIYHCNEGHAAFINLERLSNLINEENLTFGEALEVVRSTSLFTTHTPVPAGHDAFSEDLIRTYLRHIPERLKIDWDSFLNLGRGVENNVHEKFSMSVLAAKTSQEMNGVSKLHGTVSRDMFQYMWNGYAANELHIDYVTNGVHYPTWTAKAWRILYEKEFGDGFLNDQSNPKYWEKIFDVDDSIIWETRNNLRKKLIDYIKERFEVSFIRRHENPKHIMDILNSISDKTLTIGFARRFATYKRAHLIFSDIDRLAKIVNNPERPVQFLFAGKAHPHDGAGQDLIKNIIEISRRPEFAGKILFLENYDMELAKRLVSGVDIWLNNPTRPLEASGTSGQKAELNGVLNFSVLDGWWVEGYKEKAGWALPEKRTYANQEYQNELDAAVIYSLLEKDIVPLYYERYQKDIPTEWVQYVKRSIAGIAPHFTTKRMLDDYIQKFYLKLYERSKLIKENNYKAALDLCKWKNSIKETWDSIEVVSIDFPNTLKNTYKMGENYHGEVVLDLKEIDSKNIGVELVFGIDNGARIIDTKELSLDKKVDTLAFYNIDFKLKKPGTYDYGIRIFPKHNMLPHKQDFPLLQWI